MCIRDREGAVPCPVPHVLPSGKSSGGRRRTRPFPQRTGHPPRAGAGFLSHPRHPLHLYVLHRPQSYDNGGGLCPENPGGKGDAARAAPVFPPLQPPACDPVSYTHLAAVVGFLAIAMVRWLVKTDKFRIFSYYTLALGVVVIIISIIEAANGVVNIVNLIAV